MARLMYLAVPALLLAGCTTTQTSAPQPPATTAQLAEADWVHAEPVVVVLTEYKFDPSRIELRAGHPYRLHLENRGTGAHSLAAQDFFRTVALREDRVAAEARASSVIELGQGEAKDVYLVPSRTGTFPVECSHFLHPLFGMTGEIIVE